MKNGNEVTEDKLTTTEVVVSEWVRKKETGDEKVEIEVWSDCGPEAKVEAVYDIGKNNDDDFGEEKSGSK
jgi:hypothetical protein